MTCHPTGKAYPGIAYLIPIQTTGCAPGFDPVAKWVDLPIVMIDLETTGFSVEYDRIIEVGLCWGKLGRVEGKTSWLVNPGIRIPADSTKIHGITDEMVESSPTLHDIEPEILGHVWARLPAAFNASFDRKFVHHNLSCPRGVTPAYDASVDWIDPLIWSRKLFGGRHNLAKMAETYMIPPRNSHRAGDDAETALRVLYAMASDSRIPEGYARMIQEQRRLGLDQKDKERWWKR